MHDRLAAIQENAVKSIPLVDLQAHTRETGGLCMWGGGRHFSRAGETLARSSDTRRTRCSDDPCFS
jgi:hypothetical protein